MSNKLKAWLIAVALLLSLLSLCVWGAFNETVLLTIMITILAVFVGVIVWGLATLIEIALHDREMKRKYK